MNFEQVCYTTLNRNKYNTIHFCISVKHAKINHRNSLGSLHCSEPEKLSNEQ